MTEFNASTIFWKHKIQLVDLEYWLINHVGIGGRWLRKAWHDGGDVEPEDQDKWGVYSLFGECMISIVDEEDAMMFKLRWS